MFSVVAWRAAFVVNRKARSLHHKKQATRLILPTRRHRSILSWKLRRSLNSMTTVCGGVPAGRLVRPPSRQARSHGLPRAGAIEDRGPGQGAPSEAHQPNDGRDCREPQPPRPGARTKDATKAATCDASRM